MRQRLFILMLLLLVACGGDEVVEVAETAVSIPTDPTEIPAEPASPAPSQWQFTAPGGGGAFSTVGAGPSGISDLSGAYRSLDRGQSWDVLGAADGLTITHVGGLGFDPQNPDVILLASDGGIFRSADGGATVAQVLDTGYVTDIQLSASDPQIGYAGFHAEWNSSDGQVWRTGDNGRSWNRISRDLPDGLRILKLIVHPQNSDIVYLISGEGRFADGPPLAFRSMDGGISWSPLGADLGSVMDVALDRALPQIVYLTTYEPSPDAVGALWRSRDGGDSWEKVANRTGVIWPGTASGTLRLIETRFQLTWDDRNGVWETSDGGQNWTQVSQRYDWDAGWTQGFWAYEPSFNGVVRTLGEDLSDPGSLFWATGQSVFGSFDNGRSFQNLFTDAVQPGGWRSRGLDNVVLGELAKSATDGTLYAGFYDLGCWRSPDDGASWFNCNLPEYTGAWEGNGGNTLAIATDPTVPGQVWLSQAQEIEGAHTLLFSADGGQSWTEANAGLPGTVLAGLSVDAASAENGRTLFITAGGDVYTSHNHGENWALALACGGCRVTAVSPHDSSVVFAAGEAGVWRSTAGGAVGSWQEVGLPQMRGSTGEAFWDRYWAGVTAVLPHPQDPNQILVTVFGENGGLYRSDDGGERWELLLADRFMRDTAVHPQNPQFILATSASAIYSGGYEPDSSGVWLSEDGGRNWVRVNEGLDWPFANQIFFDPANPGRVWLNAPGVGVGWRNFASAVTE